MINAVLEVCAKNHGEQEKVQLNLLGVSREVLGDGVTFEVYVKGFRPGREESKKLAKHKAQYEGKFGEFKEPKRVQSIICSSEGGRRK